MGEFEHLLQRAIRDPDVILTIYAETVRFKKAVLSPRGQQFARNSVEAQYRGGTNNLRLVVCPGVFGSMKHEHMVMRVDRHTRNLTKDKPAWELWPTVHNRIGFRSVRPNPQRERSNCH